MTMEDNGRMFFLNACVNVQKHMLYIALAVKNIQPFPSVVTK